jgi:hypothetical protein
MSLKAGSEGDPPPGSPFSFGLEQKQQVGKWETCFWFSTFPRRAGAVGMWESRSDFQGLWETQGNLGSVFLVFHAPVISTVLPGFI